MLTRYLFQSGHASPAKGEIKRQGVKALYVESNLRHEVSVFDTSTLTHEEIISIGKDHVGKDRSDPLKYTFTFPEEIPTAIGLTIENDNAGHDRHCNIIQWPKTEEDKLEKEKELALAINSSAQKIFWQNKE